MTQNRLAQFLLAPFSLLYGAGIWLREWMYRQGLLKSIAFSLPIISVGNLSVGGSGKTPHIEYLIRLLRDYLEVATLSRGYRRKTHGFLEVAPRMNAEQVGDEPLQFKRKFPDIMVTVAENRVDAVPQIVGARPDIELILLDDAFQHRAIQPGMQILLTEYERPFTRDWLLPSGRLREWRKGYRRADIIIVSKCPPDLSAEQAGALRREIAPLPQQQVYFSYYEYQAPYYLFDGRYRLNWHPELEVLLISAIAGTDYLKQYLQDKIAGIHSLEYADHHFFTKYDMANLDRGFRELESKQKIILTTEKDATRLLLHQDFLKAQRLPIFVLPIEVRFLFDEGAAFDARIREFLLNFKI